MIPVNRDCAARVAAYVWQEGVDDALAHVTEVGNAIYVGRHNLGMTDDQARDFAIRFVMATLEELVELWRGPQGPLQ